MKCFQCGSEAVAICIYCGRAVCREHAKEGPVCMHACMKMAKFYLDYQKYMVSKAEMLSEMEENREIDELDMQEFSGFGESAI